MSDIEYWLAQVPEGWQSLVRETHDYLVKKCPGYRIVQVKEKFGGLRYYADGVDEDGTQFIWAQEDKSFTICQICGKPGSLKSENAWWRTTCGEH